MLYLPEIIYVSCAVFIVLAFLARTRKDRTEAIADEVNVKDPNVWAEYIKGLGMDSDSDDQSWEDGVQESEEEEISGENDIHESDEEEMSREDDEERSDEEEDDVHDSDEENMSNLIPDMEKNAEELIDQYDSDSYAQYVPGGDVLLVLDDEDLLE